MHRKKNRWGNQKGMSTTSVLAFAGILTVSSAMLVSQVKNAKSANKMLNQTDTERRMNEAALQMVTQLVTNGSIVYNAACNAAEPQVEGATGYKRGGGCFSITSAGLGDLDCAAGGGDANSWRFQRLANNSNGVSCKNPNGGLCETVSVCVPIANTRNNAGQMVSQRARFVVSFVDYKMENEGVDEAARKTRNFGYIRAQRVDAAADSKKVYPSLNAKVNFGVAADGNKGLLGKHGATDTCFYMRPATVSQSGSDGNLSFAARDPSKYGTKYELQELEPRPNGALADENSSNTFKNKGDLSFGMANSIYRDDLTYGNKMPFTDLVKDIDSKKESSVVAAYVTKIINGNYKSSNNRGARPPQSGWSSNRNAWVPNSGRGEYVSANQVLTIHDYSGSRENSYFVGVTPELGSQGGPDFQYYLTKSKSQTTKWFTHPDFWKKKDGDTQSEKIKEAKSDFKRGCGSAKTGDADFCTKVQIPADEYRATMKRRCKLITGAPIPSAAVGSPPEKRYVDRAAQVSCDSAWVSKVQGLLEKEWAELENLDGMVKRTAPGKDDRKINETLATDVIAALEVDDTFLGSKKDIWKTNPVTGSGIHPIRAAYASHSTSTTAQPNANLVDLYTVEFVGDQDKEIISQEPDGNGGTKQVVTPVPGKTRYFSYYVMEDLPNDVVAEKHTSYTCAYFSYYDADNPTQCKYSYKTSDEEGYVCRNNDGCFDETTKILMADGSERLVTQLKKGEQVYNPVTKKPARIVKLTIGPELKPLVHVNVAGRVVKVTDSHPFMTRRGWIQAKDLKVGEDVLSAENKYVPVKAVQLGQSGRTVANLALEGPANQSELHYVLADGVVTGDLVIQNMLQMKASNK